MKHIASFSGGKDSAATIILAHEHGDPLDQIIFAEVMFDQEISGELPEHIDFVKNKCIPLFESWGYKVEILHAKKTYMDCFNKVAQRSKVPERVGRRYGFPMAGKCLINDRCKVGAIREFFKTQDMDDVVQYIGIAADEPKRLKRIDGTRKVSLLAKYNYTEQMARELCERYDLLSPVYSFTSRGGCWFCPNARDNELRHLRKEHPELWRQLLELENEEDLNGAIWNTLTKTSIHSKEEQFYFEDAQMTIWDFIDQ
nr:MAG TPA: phosphoadenosine-phosphosulfate reductase [Bacteriophage sp.]